jgi:hypothetical protein
MLNLSKTRKVELSFVIKEKKKSFLITILCFSESTLRLSDAKSASRLAHIGLAYHASWGVRVAYPRSGGSIFATESLSAEMKKKNIFAQLTHSLSRSRTSQSCINDLASSPKKKKINSFSTEKVLFFSTSWNEVSIDINVCNFAYIICFT